MGILDYLLMKLFIFHIIQSDLIIIIIHLKIFTERILNLSKVV